MATAAAAVVVAVVIFSLFTFSLSTNKLSLHLLVATKNGSIRNIDSLACRMENVINVKRPNVIVMIIEHKI